MTKRAYHELLLPVSNIDYANHAIQRRPDSVSKVVPAYLDSEIKRGKWVMTSTASQ